MNTPAHVILAVAAFGRRGRPGVTAAAFAGGLVPDASLYLLAGGALAGGVPAQTVFGEYYYSDAWQAVFAVDNSIPLWALVLAVGLWRRSDVAVAFAAAGLLHLALDLPLHATDGRPHFWPVTDWVFASPVSYWDDGHHAGIVGPLEVATATALAGLAAVRLRSAVVTLALAVLLACEYATGGFWRWIF